VKIDDPKFLLRHSLLPILTLFILGAALLLFAMGTDLASPFLMIGGGVLGGVILSKRFRSPKS